MNESEIASFLEWAYPQKYCFAGPRAMQALRREAEATCTSYKIGMRGLALVTAAFFTFGHGCFSDPQYPWIAACSQLVPARREEALHRIFKKYVKRALSNMESS